MYGITLLPDDILISRVYCGGGILRTVRPTDPLQTPTPGFEEPEDIQPDYLRAPSGIPLPTAVPGFES